MFINNIEGLSVKHKKENVNNSTMCPRSSGPRENGSLLLGHIVMAIFRLQLNGVRINIAGGSSLDIVNFNLR